MPRDTHTEGKGHLNERKGPQPSPLGQSWCSGTSRGARGRGGGRRGEPRLEEGGGSRQLQARSWVSGAWEHSSPRGDSGQRWGGTQCRAVCKRKERLGGDVLGDQGPAWLPAQAQCCGTHAHPRRLPLCRADPPRGHVQASPARCLLRGEAPTPRMPATLPQGSQPRHSPDCGGGTCVCR